LIGRRRLLAVIEVGRQRDESGLCEPVGDAFDMGNKAPPLLDDDDAGPGLRRVRDIGGRRVSVRPKGNVLAHLT
jgi:hypothetical protein